MGVAIASGVPVAAGLLTGIVAGIVVGSLAGCPLQVSGPAAGLAVIVYDMVQRFGLELLGIIVLIAGLLQLVAGVLQMGQWFRAVSPAVIKGMLAGIGALIFLSQFHVMLDARPSGSAVQDLVNIPSSVAKTFTQGGLAPREQREFRSAHLRSVRGLRLQQLEIQERVEELLPTDANASQFAANLQEQIEANHPELRKLVKDQRNIAEQLDSINRVVRDFENDIETERSSRIVSAMTKTDERMSVSMADLESGKLLASIQSQAAVVESFDEYLSALKNHTLAAQIGLLTILAIVIWPLVAPTRVKAIPGPLIAVLLATGVAVALALPIVYVDIPDNILGEIRFPDWSTLQGVSWVGIVQAAVALAAVASAETLLCATATDQMHTGPKTQYNRELCAQGVGNAICGIIGALPMTGVIVRSTANIEAGGKTRRSAILHGVWLLIFVVLFASWLQSIPTSVLAAILVYTGYRLMNPASVRELKQFGWGEVAIYVVTVATIVLVDLLTGIVAGIVLATIKLLHQLSGLHARLEGDDDSGKRKLVLSGSATFLSLPRLANLLQEVPDDAKLSIGFRRLDNIDHACLDLLINWAEQHESTGGTTEIDWESLAKKYDEEQEIALPASLDD